MSSVKGSNFFLLIRHPVICYPYLEGFSNSRSFVVWPPKSNDPFSSLLKNQGNRVSSDLNYICSGTHCTLLSSEVQIRICYTSLGNFYRQWLTWPFNPASFFHWRTKIMDRRKDRLQPTGYEALMWIIAIPHYQIALIDVTNCKMSQQQPVYLRRTVWAMAASSQRTAFCHREYSHYNLCCPLSEAKASVQQRPSTPSHCGVRGNCLVIHSGQRLLRAKDIKDVVEASFRHAAQYGLSLAGKYLTAVSLAAKILSKKETKWDEPSALFFQKLLASVIINTRNINAVEERSRKR